VFHPNFAKKKLHQRLLMESLKSQSPKTLLSSTSATQARAANNGDANNANANAYADGYGNFAVGGCPSKIFAHIAHAQFMLQILL
jgi:hypothetical protein